MTGPNGSGKSTIVKKIHSTYYCGPFVNADEIQHSFNTKRVLNLNAEYGLDVSPDAFKRCLQHEGSSWITKANEDNAPNLIAFSGNYFVINKDHFVCTVDPAINIDRVAQRVALGGHDVPSDKIINRF
jgi:predicted ABC-type ATPase